MSFPPAHRVIGEALDSSTRRHWALRMLRPLCNLRPTTGLGARALRSAAPVPALSWPSAERKTHLLLSEGAGKSVFSLVARGGMSLARSILTSRCSWKACGRRCRAAPAALPAPGDSASPDP